VQRHRIELLGLVAKIIWAGGTTYGAAQKFGSWMFAQQLTNLRDDQSHFSWVAAGCGLKLTSGLE
jgi:hypothetical protein